MISIAAGEKLSSSRPYSAIPPSTAAFLLTALITLLPPLFLYPAPELVPGGLDPEALETEVRRLIRSYVGLPLDPEAAGT